jgi:regulator of sigma E protease
MIKILTGLCALGLVVFIHELGHFIAARLCKVDVETFSLGWGPVLLKKKIGNTEYRLSAFPLGGYCGMKGEHAFREALDKNLDAIPKESGSFFGAHPLRRIAISIAGPAANLIFAVLALALVSALGYSYKTYDNRIVPASAYSGEAGTPADLAGLTEGDRIVALDDTTISNYTDIQQYIGTHPQELIRLAYERDGQKHSGFVTPQLDKKTGVGRIGVYPYIPLIVRGVKPGSAAETTGIQKGDIITHVDGKPVGHLWQLYEELKPDPEQVLVKVSRNGSEIAFPLVLLYGEKDTVETGIEWEMLSVTIKGTGILESISNGIRETGKTLFLTLKSISLLFRGVDLSEAVSGPVRITMMIGEVAQTGFSGLAEFLSVICVSLFIMNLLPIPVLDGGMIVFSLIELFQRKHSITFNLSESLSSFQYFCFP